MKTSAADRIGVIGAGLAGLASACTLAARGHKVVFCERITLSPAGWTFLARPVQGGEG